ncbi:Uncharacterised protein [Klebsiella pneumoniae]|nr:Uncharacterised protein [Klebsiella pneumoniae]
MGGQQPHILRPLTQRRQIQVNHIEAVKQILAEMAFPHPFMHIAVGRGNNADIHADGFTAADALKFFLLHHPQQFHL